MAEYNPSKIIKDGNTYNFRDTTKIPLAGSNAISGSLIPSTDNAYDLGSLSYNFKSISARLLTSNDDLNLYSSYSGGIVGSFLTLKKIDSTSSSGSFQLNAHTETEIKQLIGYPDGTLTWDGQPIQYISDQRFKQQITEIDDKLLDAWEDVNPVQFKYNDAVELKSDNARLHTGYVVQQIDEACKSHGVDVSKYGLYCHEEYPERTEEVTIENEDGTISKETKVIEEASEHYSLRYTEALIVECAYLRKCIKELRTEIEELKSSK